MQCAAVTSNNPSPHLLLYFCFLQKMWNKLFQHDSLMMAKHAVQQIIRIHATFRHFTHVTKHTQFPTVQQTFTATDKLCTHSDNIKPRFFKWIFYEHFIHIMYKLPSLIWPNCGDVMAELVLLDRFPALKFIFYALCFFMKRNLMEYTSYFHFQDYCKGGEGTNQEQASMDLQVQKITCISKQTFPPKQKGPSLNSAIQNELNQNCWLLGLKSLVLYSIPPSRSSSLKSAVQNELKSKLLTSNIYIFGTDHLVQLLKNKQESNETC